MRRNWKRFASVALVLAMALCYQGCGSRKELSEATVVTREPVILDEPAISVTVAPETVPATETAAEPETTVRLTAKAGNIAEIDAGYGRIAVLRTDGTVAVIVDIAAGEYFSIGLKRDGTIIGTGETRNCNFTSLYG